MKSGVIRKCCPVCGGRIEVSYLYQYAREFHLNKDGRLSKKYTVRDCGPMECGVAACLDCGVTWDEDEFDIDSDDRFVDYKYEGDCVTCKNAVYVPEYEIHHCTIADKQCAYEEKNYD